MGSKPGAMPVRPVPISVTSQRSCRPAVVAQLPRRAPWADAVSTYAEMIMGSLPDLAGQVRWLVGEITSGLAGLELGSEPTHGDFHEGQLFVAGGVITGVGTWTPSAPDGGPTTWPA